MKPDQIYTELKNVVEKLGFRVFERTLKGPVLPVQSGDCIVHGDSQIYIDRRLGLWERVWFLAGFLETQDLDDVFVKPAVREAIERYGINFTPTSVSKKMSL